MNIHMRMRMLAEHDRRQHLKDLVVGNERLRADIEKVTNDNARLTRELTDQIDPYGHTLRDLPRVVSMLRGAFWRACDGRREAVEKNKKLQAAVELAVMHPDVPASLTHEFMNSQKEEQT